MVFRGPHLNVSTHLNRILRRNTPSYRRKREKEEIVGNVYPLFLNFLARKSTSNDPQIKSLMTADAYVPVCKSNQAKVTEADDIRAYESGYTTRKQESPPKTDDFVLNIDACEAVWHSLPPFSVLTAAAFNGDSGIAHELRLREW
ncbi:hypothetical protein ACLOJK_004832 [Asimina triloba]